MTNQQSIQLNQIIITAEGIFETPPNDAKIETPPKKPDPLTKKFDAQLVQAIDQILSSLGEPVKNTFYQHLELNFNTPKHAIPENIDKFSYLLHKAFGLGASRIEVKVLKEIQQKINFDFELVDYEVPLSKWIVSDFCFKDFVEKARRQAISKKACLKVGTD
jgi:hypothetical protein